MFGGGYGKKQKSEQELRRERAVEGLKKERADREAQQGPQVVEPIKFEKGSCEEGFFKGLNSCCNVIGYLVSCCGCCTSWDEYNGHVDYNDPALES